MTVSPTARHVFDAPAAVAAPTLADLPELVSGGIRRHAAFKSPPSAAAGVSPALAPGGGAGNAALWELPVWESAAVETERHGGGGGAATAGRVGGAQVTSRALAAFRTRWPESPRPSIRWGPHNMNYPPIRWP